MTVRSRTLLVLAALIAVADLWLDVRYILRASSATAGWDLHVTCVGLDAIKHGSDPYVAGGGPFYYPYLFHVAWVAAPLCRLSPDGSLVYAWIYLGIVIGSVLLAARALRVPWLDATLLALAAPSVLNIETWLTLTGNIEVLEVPLAALAVVFFYRGRMALAGAALAALASFKLLPIVGIFAFPLVLSKRAEYRTAVAAGLATFAVILVGNLLIMGPTRGHFATQLVGQIPRQYSATMEGGYGRTDPNVFEFASRLSDAAGLQLRNVSATGIAFLFFLLGMSVMAIRQSVLVRNPMWRTRLFCVVLISLNIGLFRLKPYSYAPLVVFLLACCVTSAGTVNPILLIVSLVAEPLATTLPLPFAGRLLYLPGALIERLAEMARVVNVYSQTSALLTVLGAILVAMYVESRQLGHDRLPAGGS